MAETTADGQELIKCSRCRCKNTIDHFKINRHGNPLKTCMACNARDRAGRACKHGREKNKCIECGGVGVCCHRRVRSACKECKGGAICEHGNRRTYCAPCGGTSLCAHGIEAKDCSICDPVGYLAKLTRGRVKSKLKATNPKLDIIEHVGCDVGQLRVHLEALFDDDMTWENYEDLIPRLHWTNLQPLWAKDNIAKGNRPKVYPVCAEIHVVNLALPSVFSRASASEIGPFFFEPPKSESNSIVAPIRCWRFRVTAVEMISRRFFETMPKE